MSLHRTNDPTFLPLAVGGLLGVGAGLSLLGDAVACKIERDRSGQGGAGGAGWFLRGTFSLVLVNAGICLMVEASKRRG